MSDPTRLMTSNDTGTGPEQDAIERVMKAMYATLGDIYEDFGDDLYTFEQFMSDAEGIVTDEETYTVTRSVLRQFAVAAIAAMQPAPPVAVTEAMIASAIEAGRVALYRLDSEGKRIVTKAMLEAALGVQEMPLEEVLGGVAKDLPGRFVGYEVRRMWEGEQVTATVRWMTPAKYGEHIHDATGTGPTMDEAIRDAVRNATEATS